jgi:outer membrane protein assembly factor BamB
MKPGGPSTRPACVAEIWTSHPNRGSARVVIGHVEIDLGRRPIMIGGIRWAAVASAALLAVGCGDAVGETIDEPPTLGPLVAERPLWDATSADAISTVLSATLHDDTAVIVGDQKDGFRLSAVDAATGTPHWSLDDDDPLPGGDGATLFRPAPNYDLPVVAGPSHDFLVYVPYYRGDDCTHPTGWCPREKNETRRVEVGIAALSGKDGTVRWMTPVVTDDEIQYLDMKLRAAGAGLVLIGISDFNHDLASLRTVALSASDGSQRWEQPGVVADFTTGETIIARIPSTPNDVTPMFVAPEGAVVALDASSGNRRWDLSQRYANSVATSVAGDFVVARATSRDGEEDTLVLNSASGHEVAHLGDYVISCSSDTSSLVACTDSRYNTVVTFQVEESEVRVSGDSIDEDISSHSYRTRGVWRGRVFVEDRYHPAQDVVVDRSANVLTDRVPGPVVAISDRYAIFRTSEDGNISVHAVTP